MTSFFPALLSLTALLAGALADDYCMYYKMVGGNKKLKGKYCTYGCCDEMTYNDPCCSVDAGTVAGIVVGVIFFIVIVVLVAIFGRRRYVRRTIRYVNHPQPVVVTTPASAHHYPCPPPSCNSERTVCH